MKPHIVIDARLYGPKHTGIGRYTKNLLLHLKKLPNFKKYRFSLLVYPSLKTKINKDLGSSYQLVSTPIPHYSLKEQIKLPILLRSLNPDLVHFTHFNKPILYKKPSVVTIHDLIKHFFKGPDTSTRFPLFYWPKYFAYRFVADTNIQTSHHLIVPSLFWKKYLIQSYQLPDSKITVTPEAVDPKFLKTEQAVHPSKNYLVYTGNLYPHKNIGIILKALQKLPDLNLKIISARNAFQKRLKQQVSQMNLDSQVEFLGFVPDQDFQKIYSRALALVHPSFMEGFSLTGLEAMALNCPVISSNSSCLPEIYGKSVLYFNPSSEKQLISQIKKLSASASLRRRLIKRGHRQLKKYSWTKTAHQTLDVYQKILRP